jgi:hypothetical protein
VLNFQEAIDSLDEGEKPSILLANGFSQAWDPEIFNYQNLLDAADFGDRDEVIRPLFDEFGTYDFEIISRHLTSTEKILRYYDPDNALIGLIVADRRILKDALINAISRTHPDLPSEISENQYIAVRAFLSQFKQIFSINYDLLFYWARNKIALLLPTTLPMMASGKGGNGKVTEPTKKFISCMADSTSMTRVK